MYRAAVLIVLCLAAARGAEPELPQGARRLGPHLYALGAVTLDARQRTVRCPGRVNMRQGGPIELLACLPHGKVHESVLVLDVKALDLQLALILLGVEPGRNPAVPLAEGQRDGARPPGGMVQLFVEWTERPAAAGQPAGEEQPRRVRRRADELLRNVRTGHPMRQTPWVLVGSRWTEDGFGADASGSVVTTFYDPLAVLELPLEQVNDDVWYEADPRVVPPLDTPVELVIEAPAAEPEEGEQRDEQEPR